MALHDEEKRPHRVAEEREIGSLWGHISINEFGSRAEREKPAIKQRNMPQVQAEEEPLTVEEIATLHYRPRTAENRVVYERLLSVTIALSEADSGTLARALLDEALAILLSPTLREIEKKAQVEDIFSSSIDGEKMGQLLALARQLSDYHATAMEHEEEEEAFGLTVVDHEPSEDENADDYLMMAGLPDAEFHQPETSEMTRQGHQESEEAEADEKRQIDIRDVDAYYLQRLLALQDEDAWESLGRATTVLALLHDPAIEDGWMLEAKLAPHLFQASRSTHEAFELLSLLIVNRLEIAGGVMLATAGDGESREAALQMLIAKGPRGAALAALAETPRIMNAEEKVTLPMAKNQQEAQRDTRQLSVLTRSATEAEDLASRHLPLPQGSFRRTHAEAGGYEEVVIPAPTTVSPLVRDAPSLLISEILPSWSWSAWAGMPMLNRIQSAVFEDAFHSTANLLVAAPTGSGKTGIALLALLRLFGVASGLQDDIQEDDSNHSTRQQHPDPLSEQQSRNQNHKRQRTKRTLAVYVAPMRALVAEMATTFSQRLGAIWTSDELAVDELTGESGGGLGVLLANSSAPLRLIVTTPEKWDVVSRKSSFLPSLLIVDEIHLLGDEMRGPALEALTARHLRNTECRIVALSATLPNAEEVAIWLRNAQLHRFGAEWRPAPLELTFFGVHPRKATKRLKGMNEILLSELTTRLPRGPAIVFVHSRRETARLARFLRDGAAAAGNLGIYTPREPLKELEFADAELRELLPSGIGIHHAGLAREDRAGVELLFADGMLSLLVSTATLAWGVNLPAHTVFIRGTDIYQEGCWRSLSPQDVLQMWGRAGRPQYDHQGEAVLMTKHEELSKFVAISIQPIHSQMLARGGEALAKHMGAEIARGAIRSIADGVRWVEQELFVGRQLAFFGLDAEELVVAAAALLQQRRLVYGGERRELLATPLGIVSAEFYLETESALRFSSATPHHSSGYEGALEIISEAPELRSLNTIREEEALALEQLAATLPLPVGQRRVATLLQAVISRVPLERHWTTLAADAVQVSAAAPRLLRALFAVLSTTASLCSLGSAGALAMASLRLARAVECRAWPQSSPVVQVDAEGRFGRLARRELSLAALRALTATELASANSSSKSSGETSSDASVGAARALRRALSVLPRAELSASAIPLTPNLLSLIVVVRPDWEGDQSARFHLLVTDIENDRIFHSSPLRIIPGGTPYRQKMHIPIPRPLPPGIMVHLLSDTHHHCDTTLPISFRSLVLPQDLPEQVVRVRELAPVSHADVRSLYQAISASARSNDPKMETEHIKDQPARGFSAEELLSPVERHLLWLLRTEGTSLVAGLPFSVLADRARMLRLLEYGAGLAASRRLVMVYSPYAGRRKMLCASLASSGLAAINADLVEGCDALVTCVNAHLACEDSAFSETGEMHMPSSASLVVVGGAALLVQLALRIAPSALVMEWGCCSATYQELLLGMARTRKMPVFLVAPSGLSSLRSLGEWAGASPRRILLLPDSDRGQRPQRILCSAGDLPQHIARMFSEHAPSKSDRDIGKDHSTMSMMPVLEAREVGSETHEEVSMFPRTLMLARDASTLCRLLIGLVVAGRLQLSVGVERIEEALEETSAAPSAEVLELLAAGIALATDPFSLHLFEDGALRLLVAPLSMAGELLSMAGDYSTIVVVDVDSCGADANEIDIVSGGSIPRTSGNGNDDAGSSNGSERYWLSMATAHPCAILLSDALFRPVEESVVVGESAFADASQLAIALAAAKGGPLNGDGDEDEMQRRMDWVCEMLWLPVRLVANPNFYHLVERSSSSVATLLSELIEEASSEDTAVDGRIAFHYQLTSSVARVIRPNLGPTTRSRGLLSIAAAAQQHEGEFYAHFGIGSGSSDGRHVLERILRASIDVCVAGGGSLATALAAMDLVQALRQRVPPSTVDDDVVLQRQLGLTAEQTSLLQKATGIAALGELALLVRQTE